MATIPTGGPDINNLVVVEQQPSLTWHINRGTGRIEGEVDGYQAVRQAVETLCNLQRFRWQIFLPSSGVDWRGLVGQNPGYVAAELRRRIAEGLAMDSRVRGLTEFSYALNGDVLTANVTVQTIYGPVSTAVEVQMG